jgi:MFS family permease
VAGEPLEPRRSPWRRWLRAIVVDTRALRHRDFRLLFAGQSITYLGSMITYVAVPYQVFQLTRSPLAVGLLSLAELGPLLLTALVGGALADAVDRRAMVRLTEVGLTLTSAGLAANALLSHPKVWVLFCAAALMAALDGLQRPSLDALVPRLVSRDELPPPPDADRASLRGIIAGLRYARSRPDLLGTYVVDIVAMLFGMPMALFPSIAARLGGARTLGLLYAAPAAGALLISAASGWVDRVHRHGVAILLAAAAWGAAIVGFGFARSLWLVLAMLAAAGAADMVSGMFRTMMWNQTIPDELRGRLAGIEMVSYVTGPLLGNVEAGLLAAAVGVPASVVSGGLLCVVGVVVVAFALPAFPAYDARGPAGSGQLGPS